MKKLSVLLVCLGLSGCYVPADYYYDDYDYAYSAPAYTTTSTYVSSAPSVVYVDQPQVVYYDSPFLVSHSYYISRPRHHYAPPHQSPHHGAPHHGGGHHPQPAPHGGSHGGHHSAPHGGGHSGSHGGHHK